MWSAVACRCFFQPEGFLWGRVIVANKMQCPSTGQRRKKLAKAYTFLRLKHRRGWAVKWAGAKKNGNCIDVITWADNYSPKSINQNDRLVRRGVKKCCESGGGVWHIARYPTMQLCSFLSCQQIIVMLLAFAHNSAVFRSLFGVCYSYATLPVLWQL